MGDVVEDVRTAFEERNDVTLYIPNVHSGNLQENSVV